MTAKFIITTEQQWREVYYNGKRGKVCLCGRAWARVWVWAGGGGGVVSVCVLGGGRGAKVHTHTRTHARTHALTHTRTHARTHPRTHAHTHTQRIHTKLNPLSRTITLCLCLCLSSASPPPPPPHPPRPTHPPKKKKNGHPSSQSGCPSHVGKAPKAHPAQPSTRVTRPYSSSLSADPRLTMHP